MPEGLVLTYLTENHKQIGFLPRPGNVLISGVYVDAFGVTEAWVDAIAGQVPGAERYVSRRGDRGWRNVGEWHSQPGMYYLIDADGSDPEQR